MRSVLRAFAVTAGAAALLAAPVPAYADGEYLRITPSTIQAGYQVEIEANCGDNVNPATVSSDAFGVVTITPTPDRNGKYLHRGRATVPGNTAAGAYKVRLTCPSQQTATTTLNVVNNDFKSRGPKTGGGYLASGGTGTTNMMIGAGGVIALAGGLMLFVARRRRESASS
ncbi:LPXTG cell wall anchor domain-containing protein [Catelliglobosispora koreensis]|uniref:LPXTG cell wall anchor domain-containing protein n=1 Tax=Catelliglobosispora koreensis TaxID=129052 RepID=UPI0003A86FBC|nr:LPXTG cell wall anchor domain-containing protein [Catelliglobosispora koreensis]